MCNKFIVEILENNLVISKTEYKNLKAIAADYTNIEYHQLYQIYKQSNGITKRKQQRYGIIKHMYENIRIYNNYTPIDYTKKLTPIDYTKQIEKVVVAVE
jgi:uncharacterized membrane protein YgaE (UPF0421/DUF939 family)